MAQEPLIAVFVDYENLAIGTRQSRKGGFKIDLVLRRLLEKGRIVYKRAYCDWSHYRNAVREFHDAGHRDSSTSPQSKVSGKNSADIRMVVDALDLCSPEAVTSTQFALISGDSDFSPDRREAEGERQTFVIGCGIKSFHLGSPDQQLRRVHLLRRPRCARSRATRPRRRRFRSKKTTSKKAGNDKLDDVGRQACSQIVRSLERDYDKVWGSMVKQAVRRVFPGFNEEYYGYSSFASLLEALEKQGVLDVEFDETRGNYLVRSARD